jgi:hypothetical protein
MQSSLVESEPPEAMMIIGLRNVIWLILTVLLTIGTLIGTDRPRFSPVQADRSTVVGRRPATFTESYRWVDGLVVDVVEVNHRRLLVAVDAPTARAGDPCSELTIVLRNGSDRLVKITLTARLHYGADFTLAASYVATAGHADHATAQYVGAGEVSYPYTLGFVLPAQARHNVVLELGINNGTHERAVFNGSIVAG